MSAAAHFSSNQKRQKHASWIPACFCPCTFDDADDHPAKRVVGLPEQVPKVQKRIKKTQNPLNPNNPLSTQLHDESSKHNSSQHPARQTEHPGSLKLDRDAIRASQTQTIFAWPFVVALMLLVTLFLGSHFAVFCACICFCLMPPQQPVSPVMKEDPAEISIISEEYKKRVVLMGLLERKKGAAPAKSGSRRDGWLGQRG
ncbi:hypothetical protein KSP39_PZI004907 [Platanthera zijinensis]|uniref:Uncharacterized protein n=1 Tax=Platanthera zijinensis TaxID=2320716 RepID=A0AAP0GDC0_9ASPA